ncbi:hypothetical protein CEUSTIGMA_g2441.t1 [Chlamydomonas eustigma]|uniref:Uncharacterized protein n=1 Tax=Chlamydomonas eustigma TaxID=1157962 RepID=A0A250WW26_9CHLO|nr:hypothetical protein CEUSTIGMA_g2441.t1 [Chlamydomonas eustigma]|eukprot:GAX74995.1 hypothetical protein CEUSTIGMA_g2441.t1 [Chlamydomonas eustigma]
MPGMNNSAMKIIGLTNCPLASQIVLAFCDLDGAGLKALGMLVPKAGYRAHSQEIGLSVCGQDLAPSPCYTLQAEENPMSPLASYLTLINICPDDQPDQPKVTLIAFNTWLPHHQQSLVAAAFMEAISTSQDRGVQSATSAPPACLFVLASALIKSAKDSSGVFYTQVGCPDLTAVIGSREVHSNTNYLDESHLSLLPASTQLQDHMLASLHHTASCIGTSAAFVLTPGHRPAAGTIPETESSEGARKLCRALMELAEASSKGQLGYASEATPSSHLAAWLEVVEARGQRVQLKNPWFWQGHSNDKNMLLCEGMYC